MYIVISFLQTNRAVCKRIRRASTATVKEGWQGIKTRERSVCISTKLQSLIRSITRVTTSQPRPAETSKRGMGWGSALIM